MRPTASHFLPLVGYFTGCLCIAAAFLIVAVAQADGWCSHEETVSSCVRNRVNAAGNGAAVIAASAAAFFALKQYSAANKQAIYAGLNSLDQRLRALRAIREYMV